MLWGSLSSSGHEELVCVQSTIDSTKQIEILEENLFKYTRNLKLVKKTNNPKHTMKNLRIVSKEKRANFKLSK